MRGIIGIFKKIRDEPKVESRTAGSSYTFHLGGTSAEKLMVNLKVLLKTTMK